MLVLLFGPSCAGKTTVIRQLSQKYGWASVPTETTRPARPGETEKTSISLEEFEKRRLNGHYLCCNCLFGNWYGTPLPSINIALESNEPYLLDMPLQSRQTVFREIRHLGIVILPESRNALHAQIKSANRKERTESVMNEYDAEYASLSLTEQDSTFRFIFNNFGNIQRTVGEVHQSISQVLQRKRDGSAY